MDLHQPLSRRGALRLASAALPALALPRLAHAATPRQVEGPFYPNVDQLALRVGALRDNDLTRVEGVLRDARGESLLITGTVLDAAARPVPDAVVEIWQANAEGRYLAAKDKRRSRPHDPGFQYFGVCPVDAEGRYVFRTVLPPAYPAGLIPGWIRPPHIHVRVRVPGQPDFVTQLYWEDPADPLLEKHRRLQRKDLIIAGVKAGDRDQLSRPVVEAPRSVARLAAFGGEQLWAPRTLDFPITLRQELYLP